MDIREHVLSRVDKSADLLTWLECASTSELLAVLTLGRSALAAARAMTDSGAKPARESAANSASIGKSGENTVETALRDHFGTVLNCTRVDKSGDFALYHSGHKIMIEVKKYSSPVPAAEVAKYVRDLDATAAHGGVFVSLKSPICGIGCKIYTRYDSTNSGAVPSIFVQSDDTEIIIGAVNMCVKLATVVRASRDMTADFSQISAANCALSAARVEIAAAATEITRRLMGASTSISRCETAVAAVADNAVYGVTPLDPFTGNSVFAGYSVETQEDCRRVATIIGGESMWKVSVRKATCQFGSISLLVGGPILSIPRVDGLISAAAEQLGADFGMNSAEFTLAINKKTISWLETSFIRS